jgi:hypothetical protein
MLTLRDDCLTFEPDNEQVYRDPKSIHDHFRLVIDYLDVVESNQLKMPNDIAASDENRLNRELYQFNILYQIVVSCVNGLTVI